jgi:diphthamide biosynthesis protein 2
METVAPALSTETDFQKVPVVKRKSKPTKELLLRRYNLDQVAEHLFNQKYKVIALQFPDGLLPDSTVISEILFDLINEKLDSPDLKSSIRVFILADTSYSPCCVDEVAAQHIHADVVVHFGNACLNPVRAIPTVYVLNELDTSVNLFDLVERFRDHYKDTESHILLMGDTQYYSILDKLYTELSPVYRNVTLTSLQPSEDDRSVIIPALEPKTTHVSSLLPKRNHPALTKELSEYSMFYLTSSSSSSPSLILHLSTLVSDLNIMNVESGAISTPQSALQRRYRYVNATRAAATIGILVNTLSIKNIDEILKRVQNWIVQSGKKHYTFVVGKPNVPKLANFEVVDVWVILGCSLGGIIVDCSEYYKPIITPYELNLALQKEIMWTGRWLIDFEDSLRSSINDYNSPNQDNGSDPDEPYFDPISGKYLDNSRPLRALEHVNVETDSLETPNIDSSFTSNALAPRNGTDIAIRGTISTAVESLSKRTWTGLNISVPNADRSSASKLEQGRSGSARGYSVSDSRRT